MLLFLWAQVSLGVIEAKTTAIISIAASDGIFEYGTFAFDNGLAYTAEERVDETIGIKRTEGYYGDVEVPYTVVSHLIAWSLLLMMQFSYERDCMCGRSYSSQNT